MIIPIKLIVENIGSSAIYDKVKANPYRAALLGLVAVAMYAVWRNR